MDEEGAREDADGGHDNAHGLEGGVGDSITSILPEICQQVFIQGSVCQDSEGLVVRELDEQEEEAPEQVEDVEDDGDDAEGDAASPQLRNEDEVTILKLTEQQQQVLGSSIFAGRF